MKIVFGNQELEISDYYDIMSFTGDDTRRLAVTLKDSSKTVDEIMKMFEGFSSDTISIDRNGEAVAYDGFIVSDISKNVDRSSERISISFIKDNNL